MAMVSDGRGGGGGSSGGHVTKVASDISDDGVDSDDTSGCDTSGSGDGKGRWWE